MILQWQKKKKMLRRVADVTTITSLGYTIYWFIRYKRDIPIAFGVQHNNPNVMTFDELLTSMKIIGGGIMTSMSLQTAACICDMFFGE